MKGQTTILHTTHRQGFLWAKTKTGSSQSLSQLKRLGEGEDSVTRAKSRQNGEGEKVVNREVNYNARRVCIHTS